MRSNSINSAGAPPPQAPATNPVPPAANPAAGQAGEAADAPVIGPNAVRGRAVSVISIGAGSQRRGSNLSAGSGEGSPNVPGSKIAERMVTLAFADMPVISENRPDLVTAQVAGGAAQPPNGLPAPLRDLAATLVQARVAVEESFSATPHTPNPIAGRPAHVVTQMPEEIGDINRPRLAQPYFAIEIGRRPFPDGPAPRIVSEITRHQELVYQDSSEQLLTPHNREERRVLYEMADESAQMLRRRFSEGSGDNPPR